MAEEKGLIHPIMQSQVSCPVCEDTNVIFYSLKAKSLASKLNIFSIPIYVDTPKYALVDFNDYFFSVCPACFFTGAKKQEFVYVESYSGQKNLSIVHPKVLTHWSENKKEIENLLVDNFVDQTSYKEPRTDEGIISSIKLGIYRSDLEIKYRVPYAHLKRGRYYLKYYYSFRKLYKKDNLDLLKLALEDLEYVFKESDFPEVSYEYEVLFLIFAIYLRPEDEKSAASYLKVLDQTKAEVLQKSKSDPRVNPTEITRWLTGQKTSGK
jgi:hypothetical protein